MEEWKEYKAIDFCENVTDGTHDSPKPVDEGHYLITSKHLQRNAIDFSSAYKISETDYLKVIQRSRVVQYDILFSMIGTIGNTVRVISPGIDFAVKNMAIFKMGGDNLKSKWLYYWLQSNTAKEYIYSRLSGSTQSYLTLDSLRNFPVYAPSEEKMRMIVELLSSLDDKIELNNRINHNLEETADEILIDAIHNQAIKKDALGSICCYVKDRVDCGILNNENYVSTDNMKPNKGGIELSSSVPDGKCISFILKDVLVSNIRPYFKKIWQATNKGGCSNDVLCFRSTNNTPSVLYHLLRSDSFFDYVMTGAKGSKMPRGDKSQIMKWEVPLFKPNYLYNLEKQLSVIDNSVSLNDLENKRLTVLRDTLLPSLLNGHINC